MLELNDDHELEMKLANKRFNPTYRTVKYWYNNWRTLNSGPRTGEGLFEVIRKYFLLRTER